MEKGKFFQNTIFDAEGNSLTSLNLEKKDLTDVIENSYFFGQFTAYHMVLKLIKLVGVEQALVFAEKKRHDIGIHNPSFVVQAEKMDKTLKKYYYDSMESKELSLKG